MAKQLLLVRHGKSDWGNSHLSDFDRPLNARGHRNAPEMASRIRHKGQLPQLLVSSPALRAITTARHFCQVWQMPPDEIQADLNIYEANSQALLNVVNGFDNKYDRIAMFGHNPGFTEFVNYLSDAGIYNVPTCGTVLLEFDEDSWAEITGDSGKLVAFDYPKSADED